jgi:hypothetical protein
MARGASCSAPRSKLFTTDSAIEHVREIIAARGLAYFEHIGDFLLNQGIRDVIIAGGSLMKGHPSDIDLFPVELEANSLAEFLRFVKADDDEQLKEVVVGPYTLQFCKETADLGLLVRGFDFAHCQVGVQFFCSRPSDIWKVKDTYFTSNFLAAMAVQGTFYVGGKWPLRSLARIPKVASKLGLTKLETQALSYQVAADIAVRGLEAVIDEDQSFAALLGVAIPKVEGPSTEDFDL